MKNLLKLEELAQFLVSLIAMIIADLPWWTYPVLIIGPDIGMLGYLVNTRVGAFTYNLLHHKGLALVLVIIGMIQDAVTLFEANAWGGDALIWTGMIMFGHASMDRIFGYGLKFGDSFQHTHLGWIGRGKRE